jgi:hypothetical protein
VAADAPVVVVCGSRRWWSHARVTLALLKVWSPQFAALWHGAARGADLFADAFARGSGIPVRRWPADWSLGRSAGVRRSAEMVAAAPPGSICVAFVLGRLADSRGTAHTVRLALRRGLRCLVVDNSGSGWLEPDAGLFA